MEPARTIVELLGGEAEVARIAGVSITAPYRWQASKAKGGTGGVIPHWHIGKLLEHAEASGVALSAANFAPVIAAVANEPQMARAS
ncbi:hypothetical protein [Methylobacterium sp. ARG-1]|uniref:hypothetical protein n=1 Tax=Methylobacterium sp. ARG-1 TaxID=1692501 RepID=UPI000682258B|nr:hypothetical protein [Methylobacterium sp. ARG-1]KNY20384.1 hypothetical protein AKJ13_22405 [Methylobacterium sp. ARG-1]